MEKELTRGDEEEERDPETRADRLLDVEEELSESLDDEVAEETRVSLDPFRDGEGANDIVEAPVVDAEHLSRYVRVEAEVEPDETRTFRLDTESDGDSQVARVCRREGVPPERFADLDTVRVVKAKDGSWYLPLPPTQRRRRFAVEHPLGGHEVSVPFLTDAFFRSIYRMNQWAFRNTPLFGPAESAHEVSQPNWLLLLTFWFGLPVVAGKLVHPSLGIPITLFIGLVLLGAQWGSRVNGRMD